MNASIFLIYCHGPTEETLGLHPPQPGIRSFSPNKAMGTYVVVPTGVIWSPAEIIKVPRKVGMGLTQLFFPHLPGEVCRFYQRCILSSSSFFSLSSSSSSTTSCRQQWALPDVNRELEGTAGRSPRAPELSVHCRTSTARSRAHWALPDVRRELQISVGTAGRSP